MENVCNQLSVTYCSLWFQQDKFTWQKKRIYIWQQLLADMKRDRVVKSLSRFVFCLIVLVGNNDTQLYIKGMGVMETYFLIGRHGNSNNISSKKTGDDNLTTQSNDSNQTSPPLIDWFIRRKVYLKMNIIFNYDYYLWIHTYLN